MTDAETNAQTTGFNDGKQGRKYRCPRGANEVEYGDGYAKGAAARLAIIEEKKRRNTRIGGIIGGIIMLSLLGMCAFIVQQGEDAQEKAKTEPYVVKNESDWGYFRNNACTVAQYEAEKLLKAPASAKWPSCVFSPPSFTHEVQGDKVVMHIRHYVDAQNAFGAMLRTYYDAEVIGPYKDPIHTNASEYIVTNIKFENNNE